MTFSVPEMLWLLLGAVLGTIVLALIVSTLAASAVQVLSPRQRQGLVLVSVLTLWVALAGTSSVLRGRSPSLPQQSPEPESSHPHPPPKRSSLAGENSAKEKPAPTEPQSVEIFPVPQAAPFSRSPKTPASQPISTSPPPSAAPSRVPSADEWVQYQDLRGIRAERRIRLGDARFIKKGGRYYVDFGKIAGLPNELEVVAADQEKVRLWLSE